MMIAALVLLASVPAAIPERDKSGLPHLRSESVLVRFADTGEVLLAKNPDEVRPIASVTKLVSALVLAEIAPELLTATTAITIDELDKDRLKYSKSRIAIGKSYPARDLLVAALSASDNRAICALARSCGLERIAFVDRMNQMATGLGMMRSTFVDPAGLDPGNVSTARDLMALVAAAASNALIRSAGLVTRVDLIDQRGSTLTLTCSNRLARSDRWNVVVGKTGYTVEAGRAFVVRVDIENRPVDMVFLGAREMQSVFGDAGRVRRWIVEKKLKS